ncbi:hypothetical protein [Sinorhizobium sp. RAC02]|uniref:hypothetical protein n=1 Tax=Sinorhizobium sp. RAC02 TaxID=1842534 RepID=UPI0012372EAE|nr:hypothetical protein [Sinorhizobium sp. RAC02]
MSNPERVSSRGDAGNEETFQIAKAYSDAIAWALRATFGRLMLNVGVAYIAFLVGMPLVTLALERPPEYNAFTVATTILISGIAIYFWRERAKLSYGLFEVIVGVAIAYDVFTSNASATGDLSTATILQFAAGLYVIVRGMDNVGKGLSGSNVGPYWRSFFEGNHSGGKNLEVTIGQHVFTFVHRTRKNHARSRQRNHNGN